MNTSSFFGIFTYGYAETESCDFSTYFTTIKLEQNLLFPNGKKLLAGYECGEAYLNHHAGVLEFVETWRCADCKKYPFDGNCCSSVGPIEPDVFYTIPVKDLFLLRWKTIQ